MSSKDNDKALDRTPAKSSISTNINNNNNSYYYSDNYRNKYSNNNTNNTHTTNNIKSNSKNSSNIARAPRTAQVQKKGVPAGGSFPRLVETDSFCSPRPPPEVSTHRPTFWVGEQAGIIMRRRRRVLTGTGSLTNSSCIGKGCSKGNSSTINSSSRNINNTNTNSIATLPTTLGLGLKVVRSVLTKMPARVISLNGRHIGGCRGNRSFNRRYHPQTTTNHNRSAR